jgi:hypothetical protein
MRKATTTPPIDKPRNGTEKPEAPFAIQIDISPTAELVRPWGTVSFSPTPDPSGTGRPLSEFRRTLNGREQVTGDGNDTTDCLACHLSPVTCHLARLDTPKHCAIMRPLRCGSPAIRRGEGGRCEVWFEAAGLRRIVSDPTRHVFSPRQASPIRGRPNRRRPVRPEGERLVLLVVGRCCAWSQPWENWRAQRGSRAIRAGRRRPDCGRCESWLT